MAKLPDSLQIALWIVGSVWLLAILALLFDVADSEVIWAALAFGIALGVWEWQVRRRGPS